jgi:ATP-dependent DNA ligase
MRTTMSAQQLLPEQPGARPAAPPERIRPALAFPAREPPEGDRWLHEVKLDGYRMFCRLERGRATFISRHGLDWTDRLGPLAFAAADIPARQAILDGEVVVHATDGVTRLALLQRALGRVRGGVIFFYAFDLLYLNGYDVTDVPLDGRKALLASLVRPAAESNRLRLSQSITGHGPTVFAEACRLGLEGIVSKRRGSRYPCGRSRSWLKLKSPIYGDTAHA